VVNDVENVGVFAHHPSNAKHWEILSISLERYRKGTEVTEREK
jgi:hypothetical protein